jgi:hypothetical protein
MIRQGPGGTDWHIEVRDEQGKKVGGAKIKIAEGPNPVFEEASVAMPGMGMMPGGYPGGVDPRLIPYLQQNDDDEDEEKELKREEKRLKLDDMRARAQEREEERQSRRQGIQTDLQRALEDLRREMTSIKGELTDKVRNFEDAFKDWKREKERSEDKARFENETKIRDLKEANTRLESLLQAGFSKLETVVASKDGGGSALTAITEIQKTAMNSRTEVDKMMLGMFQAKQEAGNPLDMAEKLTRILGIGGAAEPKDAATAAIEGATEGFKEWIELKKAQGEQMSEERIKQEVEQAKTKLLPELIDTVRQTVRDTMAKSGKPPVKPGGTPPAKPATPPAADGTPAASPPAATEAAKTSAVPAVNVNEQFRVRVNDMLKIILTEIEVMPGEAEWVDYAIARLPGPIMNKVLAAQAKLNGEVDDAKQLEVAREILNILREHADVTLLTELVGKITGDADKMAWIQKQFAILAEEMSPETPEEGK